MHRFKTRWPALLLALALLISLLPTAVLASDLDADVEDPTAGTLAAGFTPEGGEETRYYADTTLSADNTEGHIYTSAEKAFAAALGDWKSADVGTVTLYTDVTLTQFGLSGASSSSSVITIANGERLTLNLGDNTLATSDTFLYNDALPYFFHLAGTSTGDLIVNGGKIRYGSVTKPASRTFLQIGNNTTQGWNGEITFNNVDIHCISSTFIFFNKSLGGDITLNGGKYVCSDNYIVSSDQTTYNTANTTLYLTGGVELVVKQYYVACAGTNGSSVVIDDAVIYTNYANYENGYYNAETSSRPGLGIMAGVTSSGSSDSKYGKVVIAETSAMTADGTKINLDTFTPHTKSTDTEYYVYKLTIAPKAVTPAATAVKVAGFSMASGNEIFFYADTAEDTANRTYSSTGAALNAAIAAWKSVGNGTVTLYRDVTAVKGESNRMILMGKDHKLTLNLNGNTLTGNTASFYMAILEHNSELTIDNGSIVWSGATCISLCFSTSDNFTGTLTVNNVDAVVNGGAYDYIRVYSSAGTVILNGGSVKVYNVSGSSGFAARVYNLNQVDSATTYILRGGVDIWAYQYSAMRVGSKSKVYAENVTVHANAKSDYSEASIRDDVSGCWSLAGTAYDNNGAIGTKYDGKNVVCGNADGSITSQVIIGERIQYPELESRNTDSVKYLATNVAFKHETYTVTWLDEDGTVLETDTDVNIGTVPTFDKALPTKAADSEFNYFFAGWTPEVVEAAADATYTATYTAVPVSYTPATLDLKQDTTLYKTYGRVYAADRGLAINWPGSGVEFNVNCGGDVTMTYYEEESDGWFRCFVDGEETIRAAIPKSENGTVTIARGLTPGNHNIRLIREHDASTAGKKFELTSIGFFGDKNSITKPADKDLLIEFVGDSITSGKGAIVELLDPGQLYGTRGSHSGTASYAYVASQTLNADWSMVSRGSAGYFRATTCPKTVEGFYPYYNGLMADPIPYVPTRQADIAVLALCTNDGQSAIDDAVKNSTTSYTDREGAVRWLVNAVRNFHGDDVRIVMIHNMMTDNSAWVPAFEAVAESDPNAWVLKTTRDNKGGRSKTTSAGHPSEAGHAVVAQELATFLQETVIPTIPTDAPAELTAEVNGFTLTFSTGKNAVDAGTSAVITRTKADGTAVSETIPMDKWTTEGNYYTFTASTTDVKGMSDSITAKLMDANGSQITSWTGSVTGLLAESDATAPTLAALNLSAAARSFFGYNTDAETAFATEIAALKAEKAEALTAARVDGSSLVGTGADLVLGTSCLLENTMQLRFYFAENKTVTVNGEAVDLTQSGDVFYCDLPVTAADVFTEITVTVADGNTSLAVAKDSVAGYCARLYATGETELADAILLWGLTAQ